MFKSNIKVKKKFSIVVCTYRRPDLLRLLLDDLIDQTVQAAEIVVVDGDPGSGEVLERLKTLDRVSSRLIYVPSNHGNLPYQRYLGWRISVTYNNDVILYLDDDLRLPRRQAVAEVLMPFVDGTEGVVGVTAELIMGVGTYKNGDAVKERSMRSRSTDAIVRRLGTGRFIAPGGLSPSGNRVLPVQHLGDYATVEWLRGGVMAYCMKALEQDSFLDDLFALDHVKCGLGEDTLLSRRVGAKGRMLLAYNTGIEHPSIDAPKSYPIDGLRFGRASAYSRRLLNDHYRHPQKPLLSDRLALGVSLLGTSILHWANAISRPRAFRFGLAAGYSFGALKALLWPPSARRLTPSIRWWSDAEIALSESKIVGFNKEILTPSQNDPYRRD